MNLPVNRIRVASASVERRKERKEKREEEQSPMKLSHPIRGKVKMFGKSQQRKVVVDGGRDF